MKPQKWGKINVRLCKSKIDSSSLTTPSRVNELLLNDYVRLFKHANNLRIEFVDQPEP